MFGQNTLAVERRAMNAPHVGQTRARQVYGKYKVILPLGGTEVRYSTKMLNDVRTDAFFWTFGLMGWPTKCIAAKSTGLPRGAKNEVNR